MSVSGGSIVDWYLKKDGGVGPRSLCKVDTSSRNNGRWRGWRLGINWEWTICPLPNIMELSMKVPCSFVMISVGRWSHTKCTWVPITVVVVVNNGTMTGRIANIGRVDIGQVGVFLRG